MSQWPEWTSPDGRIRLINADAIAMRPRLEQFDCVIADIPYGEVNRESSGLRNLDKAEADVETFSIAEALSLAVLGESAYVFCGIEQVSELRAGFVDAGMTTRLCIWEKSNPSPMNGEHLWLSAIECCVFARKPKAYFSEHCKSPVWRGPTARNQVHPTQKPLWLIERLVQASSTEGGTILDFCAGSGTTAVACARWGRICTAIERDHRHYGTAKKRLEKEYDRTRLFDRMEATA